MVEAKDLQQILLFRELSAEEIEKIARFIFERPYRKGTVLFFEGMPGGILYLVKSGKIEIFIKKDGQDISIAHLGPNDFVGEMSLIDEEPRSAAARVVEDAVLMVVTKKSFQDIMAAIPQAANKILVTMLKILSRRLRETNRKMTPN
jgi:CRP-like cAMP-binding protein